MEKVVLFGGTFDPVTSEHINIVNALLSESFTKVIVIPTYNPPHKSASKTDAKDRLNMLKLAFDGVDGVEISDYELNLKRVVYSYETVEHFAQKYGKIYFAMGTDMLATFDKWKNPKQIVSKAQVVLIQRQGGGDNEQAVKNFEKAFGGVEKVKYIGQDVSSTEVRTFAKLSLSLEGLTSPKVEKYIYKNDIYPSNRLYDYIKQVLPTKRLIHTARVITCAKRMAKRLGIDEEKAEIASLLHDNAKYLNYRVYHGFEIPPMPKNVVHQFLGAFIAEKILGVSDEQILTAIKYHTTGRENMTTLEKVVFMADVIEKGRTFDGVEKLREETEKDFEKGFRLSIIDLYNSLGEERYFLTRKAYEYYLKEEENGTSRNYN